MFDVYPPSAAPEATRVHLFHAKQIPSGPGFLLCFVPLCLCPSVPEWLYDNKRKISVMISVDLWLNKLKNIHYLLYYIILG